MGDEEDDEHESADDALEETRPGGMFHPDTDEVTLPEDYNPPAAAADADDDDDLSTSPLTDDRLDEDEIYSEGLAAAADINDIEEDSDDSPARPLDPDE